LPGMLPCLSDTTEVLHHLWLHGWALQDRLTTLTSLIHSSITKQTKV
jgi:hypothetical protein